MLAARVPAVGAQVARLSPHVAFQPGDVFAGVGVDATHTGATNVGALDSIGALIDGLEGGLVFANLVDTDQIYGHRKDVEGFHHALQEIDAAVGLWLTRLDPQRDLLILTADHGVDPCSAGTDHTREHVPLLAAFAGHGGRRHDGPMADVGATVCAWLGSAPPPGAPGRSFL